ncbi:hypothetical protein E3U55_08150 [Filobacillus milosensis]|uniref:DUF4179 domain-containing protein n=1 Tax=Filobacillus milosensis TaxID=94137 RepID=A0A4Y8ISN5_9BACI|nr:hypothetical protein [Filobacillus milosensis]TFB21787.1 hypothetical protein E3U55_08150 [Filobacillus milosensis]
MNFEERNESNTEVKQSKENLWPQLLVGAIILVVFVLVVQMTTKPEPSEEVVDDHEEQVQEEESEDIVTPPEFPEGKLEEELIKFFSRHITGLDHAYELGLVNKLHQNIQLENINKQYQINYIWYSSNGIYVIDSIDNNNNEDLRGRFMTRFKNEDGISVTEESYGDQINFGGRLYRAQKLNPLKDNEGNLLENVNGTFNFEIEIFVKNNRTVVNNQPISFKFNKELEEPFAHRYELNEKINADHVSINFDSIQLNINGGALKMQYETEDEVFGAKGQIHFNDRGSMFNTSFNQSGANEIQLPFSTKNPEILEVQMDEVILISDNEFDFKINLNDIKSGERKEINKLIGEHNGSKYYLKEVTYYGGEIQVTINTDLREGQIRHDIYGLRPSVIKSGPRYNLLTISNGDGEPFDFKGFSTHMSQTEIGFTLPEKLIEEIDVAHVNISDLTYIQFIDESVTFDLSGS